jgi:hypothetical protein
MILVAPKWFAELDRISAGEAFMKGGRKQSKAPRRKIFR